MISPSTFRDLVSGRRRGVGATVLRAVLRVCEWPYRWAVCWRNRKYDRGRAEVHAAGVPVVCVGNLTLGGTGKTPVVEWLAHFLQGIGKRVVLVSRGYGSTEGEPNDEALELQLTLPGVPHLQDRDRVAAALQAVEQHQAEVIVLDDGFQHRRLARDLDVVLLDASEPFGFEHVFPRGTLREPLAGLSRADVVVLSRANLLSAPELERIFARVAQLAPQALRCAVAFRPQQLINSDGERRPLELLDNKRVAVFCAIGNPAGLRHTLGELGCEVIAWREFADHHRYSEADIESLSTWAADADIALCTRKDLVKLKQAHLGKVALLALQIESGFLAGQEELQNALEQLVEKV